MDDEKDKVSKFELCVIVPSRNNESMIIEVTWDPSNKYGSLVEQTLNRRFGSENYGMICHVQLDKTEKILMCDIDFWDYRKHIVTIIYRSKSLPMMRDIIPTSAYTTEYDNRAVSISTTNVNWNTNADINMKKNVSNASSNTNTNTNTKSKMTNQNQLLDESNINDTLAIRTINNNNDMKSKSVGRFVL